MLLTPSANYTCVLRCLSFYCTELYIYLQGDLMQNPSLEDIVAVDTWARDAVDAVLPKVSEWVKENE